MANNTFPPLSTGQIEAAELVERYLPSGNSQPTTVTTGEIRNFGTPGTGQLLQRLRDFLERAANTLSLADYTQQCFEAIGILQQK